MNIENLFNTLVEDAFNNNQLLADGTKIKANSNYYIVDWAGETVSDMFDEFIKKIDNIENKSEEDLRKEILVFLADKNNSLRCYNPADRDKKSYQIKDLGSIEVVKNIPGSYFNAAPEDEVSESWDDNPDYDNESLDPADYQGYICIKDSDGKILYEKEYDDNAHLIDIVDAMKSDEPFDLLFEIVNDLNEKEAENIEKILPKEGVIELYVDYGFTPTYGYNDIPGGTYYEDDDYESIDSYKDKFNVTWNYENGYPEVILKKVDAEKII